MIRLFNAYFPTRTLLLTVTEAALVTLGFVLAVEFWAGTASDASIYLLYENGLGRIGLVVAVFLILMYYFDLYDSFVLANRREVVTRLVGVLGCAFVALAVLYYVFPEVSLGGSTLWIGVGIVGVAVPAWRKLFSVLNRSARFSQRAILYGDGPLAGPLMEEMSNRSELGVRVVGFVGQSAPTVPGVPQFDDGDIEELAEKRNVQRVVVTMGDRRGKLQVENLLKLKARGVYIQDGPEYYESITGKIPLESLRLSWLLFSPGFHVRTALHLYKRLFSLILGSLAIIVTSPLMLLAAVAAGTSWIGIRALSSMNHDAETMASAAKRALEAAHASTSLITLSSAEFQVALDPRPENRAIVHKLVDEQIKLFKERVEDFGKTRDEKTRAMMPAIKETMAAYEKDMEKTLRIADETKDVQLSEQVERLRTSAMNSQVIAVKLRTEIRAAANELDNRVNEFAKQASEEYLATSNRLMIITAVGIILGVLAGY